MKTLFFLLIFSIFSFAQNANSKTPKNSQPPCTFEMTVDQLTSSALNFKCIEAFGSSPFMIKNFKVKFFGSPAVMISGNALNDQAKILAENLKEGDNVIIFDIESITADKAENNDYQSLSIKIVE